MKHAPNPSKTPSQPLENRFRTLRFTFPTPSVPAQTASETHPAKHGSVRSTSPGRRPLIPAAARADFSALFAYCRFRKAAARACQPCENAAGSERAKLWSAAIRGRFRSPAPCAFGKRPDPATGIGFSPDGPLPAHLPRSARCASSRSASFSRSHATAACESGECAPTSSGLVAAPAYRQAGSKGQAACRSAKS